METLFSIFQKRSSANWPLGQSFRGTRAPGNGVLECLPIIIITYMDIILPDCILAGTPGIFIATTYE